MRHLLPSFVRTLMVTGPVALSLMVATPAHSGTGAISTSDRNDFQGDQISFSVALGGKPVGDNDMLSDDCQKAFIPVGVTLVGQGREQVVGSDGKTVVDNQIFVIVCRKGGFVWGPTIQDCTDHIRSLRACDGTRLYRNSVTGAECGNDPNEQCAFAVGETVKIPATALQTIKPNRYGLAYGALAVPFKFQLTGKKEFQGSASVGPYLGYRFDRQGTAGYALTLMAFAGVANVKGEETKTKENTTTDDSGNTTTTVSKDEDSTNLAAFSYGVGLLGVVKNGFQLGAVLGFDHADSGKGFKYNDKPWIAVQIGYEFSLPD